MRFRESNASGDGFEPGPLSRVGQWLGVVLLQTVAAELLRFFCGWLPELKFSTHLADSAWRPYAPVFAAAAVMLGFYISPVLLKGKGARSTWLIGVLWLGCGLLEAASRWNPTFSEPSRWTSAVASLFGTADQCEESNCMAELYFTAPSVVAIAYSIGALIYVCWESVKGTALRKNRGEL